MVTTDDDAKALAERCDEIRRRLTKDGIQARACDALREAGAMLHKQSARITDLETQVRGDAETIQRAVDTEVELRTQLRDVRRKALEEAIRAVHEWEGDESTDLAIDEMLRELIDRDPDHAD